jgi:hypothetical protein
VESNEVGRDGVRVVKGLCKSENFRSVDQDVRHTLPTLPLFQLKFGLLQVRLLSGRLEVVDLCAHGGGALPPQELLQQQLHNLTLAASQKATDALALSASAAEAGGTSACHVPKSAFSCNTCAGAFADAAEHRAHFK